MMGWGRGGPYFWSRPMGCQNTLTAVGMSEHAHGISNSGWGLWPVGLGGCLFLWPVEGGWVEGGGWRVEVGGWSVDKTHNFLNISGAKFYCRNVPLELSLSTFGAKWRKIRKCTSRALFK